MQLSSQQCRQTPWIETRPAYDLVGIGFGPANLALAATLREESEALVGRELTSRFFERRESFGWHPGLLLGGARIQLTFIKDLVTLRNPRSHFTFLNYLRAVGRLDEFANLRNFFPTRIEFSRYYQWVADQLEDLVSYGTEVVAIAAVGGEEGGPVEELLVSVRHLDSGEVETSRARNLVVATGGVPKLPGDVDVRASRRVFHSQDFLPAIAEHFTDRDREWRFVVVGSGQTAAELFQHLYTRYPNADVTAALRRFAYKPADDSHFVNEIFFPRMVDLLYGMPAERRAQVLEAHMDTNYSAVDLDLIQEIYEELYQRRVAGDGRVRIRPFLELRGLVDHETRTVLHFQDVARDWPVVLEADGVFLATGYTRPERHPLLAAIEPYLVAEGDGYAVERDYRIRSRPDFLPGVFLQGFCQATHGLSDTLLSTLPLRSVEILRGLHLDQVDPGEATESGRDARPATVTALDQRAL